MNLAVIECHERNGIVLTLIFQGLTDPAVFEDRFKQLVYNYGRFPVSEFGLVMDNDVFHHFKSIEYMCLKVGVESVYFP